MRFPRRPLLILTRHGRTPGPREDVPKPRLVSQSDLPVPAQPRTSDLQPARFGSEGPDPPNWGQQGMGEHEGDRKRCRGLTCVAASSVSWSGSKPIWTFSGRWRKHLQNLKSGRRYRRQNGGGARTATPGRVGLPKPSEGPTPGGLGEQPGLLGLPRKPSARATPSLSRGCFYPGRRRNPEVVDGFRCKRSKGPDTPGTRTAGERDSLPGRRVPLRRCSELGALPCACRPGAGRRRWPPIPSERSPGRGELDSGKREGLPGHSPLSTARTVRPCSDLERLRRATFRCPSRY